MAQCKTCHKPLPKAAKFCGYCGVKVLERCPKCGNTDLPGPNFCVRCGAPLRPELASPEAEEAIEAELKMYKATWEQGRQIITCQSCGAKNRVSTSKLHLRPSCGRCKAPLSTE